MLSSSVCSLGEVFRTWGLVPQRESAVFCFPASLDLLPQQCTLEESVGPWGAPSGFLAPASWVPAGWCHSRPAPRQEVSLLLLEPWDQSCCWSSSLWGPTGSASEDRGASGEAMRGGRTWFWIRTCRRCPAGWIRAFCPSPSTQAWPQRRGSCCCWGEMRKLCVKPSARWTRVRSETIFKAFTFRFLELIKISAEFQFHVLTLSQVTWNERKRK